MVNLSIDNICARLKKVPVEEWKEEYQLQKHTYSVDVSGMSFRVSYEKTETPRAADEDNPSGAPLIQEEAQLDVIDPNEKLVVFTTNGDVSYGIHGAALLVNLYNNIKESVNQYKLKFNEQNKKRSLAGARARLEAIVNE